MLMLGGMLLQSPLSAKQKGTLAFPGAEGHGRYTVGGRGGKVYHVTNLEDDVHGRIKGSLRWAMKQKGAKTIVFDVAGTIHLKRDLRTRHDSLTIAGQTSPGGICLADYPFTVDSDEVIIRFLRFRPGDASGREPDGLGGSDCKNVIIDHCSVSWSVDECLSIYGMENSTVQWCIASQALRLSTHSKKAHCYGGNWGGYKASYHHNLIAHCESRTPRLGPRQGTQMNEYVDIRNNVFYNWSGGGCYGGENQHVNLVANYYKPGPATKASKDTRVNYRIARIGVRTTEYVTGRNGMPNGWKPAEHRWGTFYVTDNKVEGHDDVTQDNWTKGVYGQQENGPHVDYLWTEETKASLREERPVVPAGGVTTHSAEKAYRLVLDYVGASNYRDVVDRLIIDDVKNGRASCTVAGNEMGYINKPTDIAQVLPELKDNPYPNLKLDTSRPIKDTDGDGMPDEWETQKGLNPNDASDAVKYNLSPDYTNLEVYMNGLVENTFPAR